MKCSTTALSKTILHFFLPTPNFFLLQFKVGQADNYTFFSPAHFFKKAIQSWPGRRIIKYSPFYNFFSLHWGAPHLKHPNETNAPPLPIPKVYYTFFSPHPIFFKAIQSWPGRHIRKYSPFYTFSSLLRGGGEILPKNVKKFSHPLKTFSPPEKIVPENV